MLDSMGSLFGKYRCCCITTEEVKHQFKMESSLFLGHFPDRKD